jgi:hypothetical protein
MKIFSALILLLILGLNASAQDEAVDVYQIRNVYQNADLNAAAIEKYQKNSKLHANIVEVTKLFKPVKGKYKVIFFTATGYGFLKNEGKNIYHSILILKVNKNNEILDGLEYLLEWAETPHTVRLFRTAGAGVKLQKGLQLSQLDWKPFAEGLDRTPQGIIDNLYDFKKIF